MTDFCGMATSGGEGTGVVSPPPVFLERVAYGEVDGLAVLEVWYVVEAALARLVRHVQTYAPVEAQHEEV